MGDFRQKNTKALKKLVKIVQKNSIFTEDINIGFLLTYILVKEKAKKKLGALSAKQHT